MADEVGGADQGQQLTARSSHRELLTREVGGQRYKLSGESVKDGISDYTFLLTISMVSPSMEPICARQQVITS